MSPDDKTDVPNKDDKEKPVTNTGQVSDKKDITPPLSFKTDQTGNFSAKAADEKKQQEAGADSSASELIIPADKNENDD